MSTTSKIEWTDATWNPVTGCTRVSAGCDHCYAVKQTYRLEQMGQREKYGGLTVLNRAGDRHFNGVVKCHTDALQIPIRRKKPTMYFVNSMSDLFHARVPFAFVDKVFAVMALCPQHTFQVLTKRPVRMEDYTSSRHDVLTEMHATGRQYLECDGIMPLSNVWLGISVEDQTIADENIPHLLRCPAAVRFLSIEPLLGPVDVSRALTNGDTAGVKRADVPTVDWVIVGGESGPGARPCNTEWIRSIIRQCKAAGIACFVKQLGKHIIDHRATSATTEPESECWPDGTKTNGHRIMLKNSKGGNMAEWAEDLRVRRMPA